MGKRLEILAMSLALMASILGGEALGSLEPAVSGCVSVPFQSKVLSYGLPDSDDPNFLPYGELQFFDTLSVGSRFYVDITGIGRKMGRGDRRWDFWEADFPVNLRHVFAPGEFAAVPTSIELGVGYRYEYHPPRAHIPDTQFWIADVSLPDVWLVPCFSYERDVIRDNGTYLNLSLAHEFEVLGDVTLTPSVSQGWGNYQRVRGYLTGPMTNRPLDRAGLMDFQLRLSLAWRLTESLSFSASVAYSDFLFDRHIRDAARNYIRAASGGTSSRCSSWCFPASVAVTWQF